jgi:peptidoglycan/xylan/chitin deacetylase (PgdA/CDA1 family)
MYTLLFISSLIQSPPLYTKSKSPHGLPCHNHTIRGKQHVICWTVDDHPFRTTPHMLRLLKQRKLKATFFVVGSMLRYHSIRPTKYNKRYVRWFKAIVKAGHTVGNHSVTHGRVCRMKAKDVRWELTETQRVMKLYGGKAPVYFRPPHGVWCRRLAREVKRLKLVKVMYNVSDYKSNARRMWRELRWRMRKGKKYTIVLVHYNHRILRRLLNLIKLNP